jgi:UDP-N-acetylmuramate: L-alanyl-gamma-D-glutamyl-meso-diaminopimelate ligase
MQIHLIAIGGSAMHNIALALQSNGHTVSGSDDEIYNPARERLSAAGLLPAQTGWYPDRIHPELDLVILGMHARIDNPELKRAQELNIPVYSYPAYLYHHAAQKQRVVIGGSHGKTTTTSILMHLLLKSNSNFDYLVGAQIEGFQQMVRFSDAPLMVIEGDEYLSSPTDRRPKFLHYHPQLAVLTGIAWDHMNVFPTFENYLDQFRLFIESIPEGGKLFYYEQDAYLPDLVKNYGQHIECVPYHGFEWRVSDGQTQFKWRGSWHSVPLFGQHNMENMMAACLLALELGFTMEELVPLLASFRGASKRLEQKAQNGARTAYLDFAHAPSKVTATLKAVCQQHEPQSVMAVFELHTFSSLNRDFLPQYKQALDGAKRAVVLFSPHTLEMKQMPPLDPAFIKECFGRDDLMVITSRQELEELLKKGEKDCEVLLLMSSGKLDGLPIEDACTQFVA